MASCSFAGRRLIGLVLWSALMAFLLLPWNIQAFVPITFATRMRWQKAFPSSSSSNSGPVFPTTRNSQWPRRSNNSSNSRNNSIRPQATMIGGDGGLWGGNTNWSFTLTLWIFCYVNYLLKKEEEEGSQSQILVYEILIKSQNYLEHLQSFQISTICFILSIPLTILRQCFHNLVLLISKLPTSIFMELLSLSPMECFLLEYKLNKVTSYCSQDPKQLFFPEFYQTPIAYDDNDDDDTGTEEIIDDDHQFFFLSKILIFPIWEEFIFRQFLSFVFRPIRSGLFCPSFLVSGHSAAAAAATATTIVDCHQPFAIVSSILFGMAHVANSRSRHSWKQQLVTQLDAQIALVTIGEVIMVTYLSWTIMTPIFLNYGILASIGIHMTWNFSMSVLTWMISSIPLFSSNEKR